MTEESTTNTAEEVVVKDIISIKTRYIAAIFSRKFLIFLISSILLLIGYYTDWIDGFEGEEIYYVTIVGFFVGAHVLEIGNPQSDIALAKAMGTKGFISYKIGLIFGPEFAGYAFVAACFWFGVLKAGEYTFAASVYIGANTLNKVGEMAGSLKNLPMLRNVIGNGGSQ